MEGEEFLTRSTIINDILSFFSSEPHIFRPVLVFIELVIAWPSGVVRIPDTELNIQPSTKWLSSVNMVNFTKYFFFLFSFEMWLIKPEMQSLLRWLLAIWKYFVQSKWGLMIINWQSARTTHDWFENICWRPTKDKKATNREDKFKWSGI